ncbi:hypothetical protein THRCLA_21671 [Thraustotheca clavata]|uniref:Secreted protein n=1 Tax=Thraustotheca clavata TaxID=74557 RepID=A0A1V9ZRI7_9STRA|nr:hypothetical protein THRCLA_21671 [Thraustotheca clavata]
MAQRIAFLFAILLAITASYRAQAQDPICAVKECTVIITGKVCNRLVEDCPTCLSQLMGGKTAMCTNATFDGCQGGTICKSVTTLTPTTTAPSNPTSTPTGTTSTPTSTVPGNSTTIPTEVPSITTSNPTPTTAPKTTTPTSSSSMAQISSISIVFTTIIVLLASF